MDKAIYDQYTGMHQKETRRLTKNLKDLEQRQNINDLIQSKIIPRLKLPLFSPDRIGGEKARQFLTWNYF